MRLSLTVALLLAFAATASSVQGAGVVKLVLHSDFEADPAAAGWTTVVGARQTAPLWATGAGHSGSHCLAFQTGSGPWQSPLFTPVPLAWYRADFWYRTHDRGAVAAFGYRDAAATDFLAADYYSELRAGADWTRKTVYFRAHREASATRVLFMTGWGHGPDQLLQVDDLTVEQVTDEETLRAADALWAKMPRQTWQPPADRWKLIPYSIARLRQGRTLRVLALGDSILNDTTNGPWELLVERAYPGARILFQASVRGGTGCSYFQDPAILKRYVLDHDPDLVLLSGTSQRGDLVAMRSVIHQIRVRVPGVEIMQLTIPCGQFSDPRSNPEWAAVVDPQGDNWRSDLWRLSREERLEFFDTSAPWGVFMRGHTEDYDTYLRDGGHANDRGRMVLARALAAWFSP